MEATFDKFRLFLSASIPKKERDKKYYSNDLEELMRKTGDDGLKYKKINNAQTQIEEAVICIARTVFAHGGQLVFGGHPSISPLVSIIAEEYVQGEDETGYGEIDTTKRQGKSYHASENGIPPIVIYQSEVYSDSLPHETRQMLAQGHAYIRWTNRINDEAHNPEINGEQCLESMKFMREEMIGENELDAMVCIGGMEGIERELKIFIDRYGHSKPIFVFGSTGGAAAIIAREKKEMGNIIVVDAAIQEDRPLGTLDSVEYLSIAAEIVETILRNKGRM